MEQPLDKISPDPVCGYKKKRSGDQRDPLELSRRQIPEIGADYEKSFLEAFRKTNNRAPQRLLDMMIARCVRREK
jgi:hypothetical protein